MQIPKLETERLLLRAPDKQDANVFCQFYADAEASQFYGGPKTTLQAWNVLARNIGHWHLRGFGIWTLEDKTDGTIVSGCGLFWPDGWPRSELTWWIAASARRKGFAKEASRAAIEFGYGVLKWKIVQTHMKDENIAAKSLTQSLGGIAIAREMFPDGIDRDVYKLPRHGGA